MNQTLDHLEHLRRPDFLSNDAVSLVSEFFGIAGTVIEQIGPRIETASMKILKKRLSNIP